MNDKKQVELHLVIIEKLDRSKFCKDTCLWFQIVYKFET